MADQPNAWGDFPRLHDKYPDLGTGPVPTEPYHSQAHFELERDLIFRKSWLIVGRVEEIPNPGDYLAMDIEVARSAILIVRGRDGEVGAFYNQCSHRGSKVVRSGTGSCKLFQCPFHGWIYNLDGSLRGIPDEKGYFDLDKAGLSLTPLAADVWSGFIFVNFDPQPAESLSEFLGAFGTDIGDYPFGAFADNMAEWRVELNCNWKIFKDAFQEGFHLPFLHHRTLGGIYSNSSNPFNYVLDCKLYPRHHSMSQPGADRPIEPTGLMKIARDFGAPEAQHAASLQANEDHAFSYTPGTNWTRNPRWDVDLHAIFPNITMNTFAAGRYLINIIWPLSLDRTLWIARSYSPKPRTAGERFSFEFNKVFLRDILIEDGSTVEGTHAAIRSGAKQTMPLHEQEIMVRHDRKVIEDHVGFYRDREAPRG
ncbi:MAG: aromatic ring-hydroxylating dioxygenase subunit alpha [Sphingomonadales bacterium]|nr:MAG: aromatic ring-hydroxylating dioxygenase subunit alpha [Sphingomonadales bacterium]